MELRRLSLRNFKPFREVEIDVPANGIVALVGANNAGKSAFLSALDLLAGFDRGGQVVRAGSGAAAEVIARFFLADSERSAFMGDWLARDRWLGSAAFSEVELRFRSLSAERMFLAEVYVLDARGEWRRIGVTLQNEGGRTFSYGALNIGDLREQDTDVELNAAAIGSSDNPDFLPWGGGLEPIGQLLQAWRRGFYHFQGIQMHAGREAPAHAAAQLDPSGQNLPQALLYLKAGDDPAYAEIERVVCEVFPDLGRLTTPMDGDRVQVVFRDPDLGVPLNVRDLGASVEQALVIAYVGTRQPAGSVVVLEEPETNLDSSAQRRLAGRLAEWSQTRLIVLSTHSAAIIEQVLPAATVLLVERKAGVATVREAGGDLEVVVGALEGTELAGRPAS